MKPRIDVVTQEEAKKDLLIIGVQAGFLGYILRLGFYKQGICAPTLASAS